MNLRHIEIFHAVYVNGSVSAAARALNVSQPSVSKMLRHAESLLGFNLFQRTNGGLVPTEGRCAHDQVLARPTAIKLALEHEITCNRTLTATA